MDRDVASNGAGILVPAAHIANPDRDFRIIRSFQNITDIYCDRFDRNSIGYKLHRMPDSNVVSLDGHVTGNGTGVCVPFPTVTIPFRNGRVVGILQDIPIVYGHGLHSFPVCHKGYCMLHNGIGFRSDSLLRPQAVQVVGVGDGSLGISFRGCRRSQLPPILPGEVPAGISVKVADGIAALHRAADCAGIWVEGLTLVGNALSIDGCQKIRPAGIVIGVCNLLIVPILAPGILGKNIACCIIGIMEGCGPVFVHCRDQLALGVVGVGD